MPEVECSKLKVSGDDYQGCLGTYTISNEKASKAPERPVWKKAGWDRYILFMPNIDGWTIGYRISLSPSKVVGNYFLKFLLRSK